MLYEIVSGIVIICLFGAAFAPVLADPNGEEVRKRMKR